MKIFRLPHPRRAQVTYVQAISQTLRAQWHAFLDARMVGGFEGNADRWASTGNYRVMLEDAHLLDETTAEERQNATVGSRALAITRVRLPRVVSIRLSRERIAVTSRVRFTVN